MLQPEDVQRGGEKTPPWNESFSVFDTAFVLRSKYRQGTGMHRSGKRNSHIPFNAEPPIPSFPLTAGGTTGLLHNRRVHNLPKRSIDAPETAHRISENSNGYGLAR